MTFKDKASYDATPPCTQRQDCMYTNTSPVVSPLFFVQALAYAFVSVHDQPSVDIAREINRCQLHVLLELNGHTKGNRLDILALQPAAVQVRLCFIFPSSLLRFHLLISAKEPYK